jgi:hypothetical protein
MIKFLNLILAICMTIATSSIYAQIGKKFPAFHVHSLDDKNINLPSDAKGKYTLIGMAYSKAAEEELVTWFQPAFNTFIEKPKGLFTETYDINLYFIPMFTGVNQAASETAKKKLKESLDKNLVPYLLIYKGELKEYKEKLNLERKDSPYFFVLDKEGTVIYTTSGKFSEEKMDKIEELISE